MSPGTVLSCCLLLYLLITYLDAKQFSSLEVIADTRWGRIIGERKTIEELLEYYSFEGVPYALPPVGDLRLAKPVSIMGRIFRPYRANAVKPGCYGFSYGSASEDCLYLDIYVPALPHRGLRAVMVYFHGGSFVHAFKKPYMVSWMSQGSSVIVFVHYRLGPFGFLSAADSFLKGNYGLWDQTMALRWVKSNIYAFGGDPGRVTIFGNSAGAASVAYHVLAPPSKGLFQRAIMLSGSVTSTWAIQRDPRSVLRDVAASVGCPFLGETEDVNIRTRLVTCLRQVKARALFQASYNRSRHHLGELGDYLFEPVVDGEFVPAEPSVLLGNQTHLISQGVLERDFILGVLNNEGSLLAGDRVPQRPDFGKFYVNKLVPTQLYKRYGRPGSAAAKRAVSIYYSRDASKDLRSLKPDMVRHVFAHPGFLIPALEFSRGVADLQEQLRGRGKTYFYYFNYCPRHFHCMEHGLDITMFLFPISHALIMPPPHLARMFIKLLTSFAASGIPEASGLGQPWLPFRNTTGYKVLKLDEVSEMKSGLFYFTEKLWLDILPRLMRQGK